MATFLNPILVIDVESTCWEGAPPEGQTSEIIEIGLCILDTRTLERMEKRSILVRPEKSTISDFCTELTTLRSEDFADAMSFPEALQVLRREYKSRDRAWASWGDYDRRQFERNCALYDAPYPFGRTHLNVKSLFGLAMGHVHETGMDTACEILGRPLEGTHHRGADDAWNIAGVLAELLRNARTGLPVKLNGE